MSLVLITFYIFSLPVEDDYVTSRQGTADKNSLGPILAHIILCFLMHIVLSK